MKFGGCAIGFSLEVGDVIWVQYDEGCGGLISFIRDNQFLRQGGDNKILLKGACPEANKARIFVKKLITKFGLRIKKEETRADGILFILTSVNCN